MVMPLNLYYYLLAKDGSYWGRRCYEVILSANDEKEIQKQLDEIKESRKNYFSTKEKKEKLRTYNPSIINKLALPTLIPFTVAVPFMSFLFYLPIFLFDLEDHKQIQEMKKSERFLVTKDFLNQTLAVSAPLDLPPPSVPLQAETPRPTDEVLPIEADVPESLPPLPPTGFQVN